MLISNKISRFNNLLSVKYQHFKVFSTQVSFEDAKSFNEIPGPKNAFQFMQLLLPGGKYYKISPSELIKQWRNSYGTIATLPGFFGVPSLVITYLPDDIEKVFRTEGKFPNRRPLESILYFRKHERPDLYPAGAGLIVTQGQEWYDFRTKVQQIMMQPRATKVYIPGIDGVACDFIKKIREIRDENNETPADFWETLTLWALESIGIIALDTRLGAMDNPEATKITELIKIIFENINKYDFEPSIWRYYKMPGFKRAMKTYEETRNELRKYIDQAIERLEKNPTADDHEMGILEKLIKIDRNIGVTMAEDMLFAGVDTTSSAISAVMYNLAKNPEKQEILRKEVFSILPDKNSKLSASSFNNAPYLRAVMKESQRMHPITNGNVRQLDVDIVLQGYRIPKGTDILVTSNMLALNEEHFERAGEFIPERWLKNNTEKGCPNAKDSHPFTYLPFGFGSRMCIGRRFAELEIEVLTTRLLREFKIEWHQPDLKYKLVTINIPETPLKYKMIDI
ncbi:CLUMA_CG016420, isoform A [Clunio marinus]|uniref:CLUMA_CG016420, isoform A n=1 Tax=Clunio marinus TaxID=568069 RepID=A0A1J1IVM1_9DIPT|nr:CLUMA_CG016420, isoform A [Clunio marinus]